MKNKFSLWILSILWISFVTYLIFPGVIKYILIDPFQISWVLIVFILSLSSIFFMAFSLIWGVLDLINSDKNLIFVGKMSSIIAVLVSFALINSFYNKDLFNLNKCKKVILNERYTLTLEEVEKLDKNKDRLCLNKNVVPNFLEYYVSKDKQKLDSKLKKESIEKEMRENIEKVKELKKEEILKKYIEE